MISKVLMLFYWCVLKDVSYSVSGCFDWRITLSGIRPTNWSFMPDYRRYRVPGGTYFFTVNLLERRLDTLVRHIDVFREAVRKTRRERPFHIDAWVVLPDHMHCIWTLPPSDDEFSNRWKSIKIRFVQAIPRIERRSPVRIAKGERGI
jgi:putative transposase